MGKEAHILPTSSLSDYECGFSSGTGLDGKEHRWCSSLMFLFFYSFGPCEKSEAAAAERSITTAKVGA